MGCQTDIAEKIVGKQADYVLAVKDNQKLLHEAVTDYFEVVIAANNPALCQLQAHEETHPGHGRIETRRKGLKSMGMVESERFINGAASIERRHYLCTLTDVKPFAQAARAHWGVENSLHWVLDVTFREDDSRIRTGYAPENFSVVRQLAINLLKKEPSKLSVKRKRFKAALSDRFRENVVFSTWHLYALALEGKTELRALRGGVLGLESKVNTCEPTINPVKSEESKMLTDSSQKATWLVLVFAYSQTRITKPSGNSWASNPSLLFT